MERGLLERLGLVVDDGADGVTRARLEPSPQLFNPVARRPLEGVAFTLDGERLRYAEPPELVGLPAINLSLLPPGAKLESVVAEGFNRQLAALQRRSSELGAMGLHPQVDPRTLRLTAELEAPPLRFVIAADRAGRFRVAEASIDGEAVGLEGADTSFELSEHRDRSTLLTFFGAMFRELFEATLPAAGGPSPVPGDCALTFAELTRAFGDTALPPRSGLEVLATVRVGDEVLRFAAARVQGRIFRGLLAGPRGKLWAGRFELDTFPGVAALVAEVLKVSVDDVRVEP